MTAPIPKTKIQDLKDRLFNFMKQSRYHVNQIQLQRFKNEAELQIQHDPAWAFMLLGNIAALAGDQEAMERNLNKALSSNGNICDINFNYGLFLAHFYRFNEAVVKLEIAYNLNKTDPEIIWQLILIETLAGNYRKCSAWIAVLEKLQPGVTAKEYGELNRIKTFIDQLNIPEEDIRMLVGVATNLLSERQIWGCVCHEELLEDEADEWLSIQYLVPKSVAEISELGWEFARRMSVMELPELADRYVNVMFLPKVEEGA